jgi:hypothetical protein
MLTEESARPVTGAVEQGGAQAKPALPAFRIPEAPRTVEETGLPEAFVDDLMMKALYRLHSPTAQQVASIVKLPPLLTRQVLDQLRHRKLCETTSGSGALETEWRYALTGMGTDEALSAFKRSAYMGPAPVPLSHYLAFLRFDRQPARPDPPSFMKLLSRLVLSRESQITVARSFTAGRPAILWGAPGNGKTTILEMCGKAILGATLMPHAVLVSGQIIRIFDPAVHQALEEDVSAARLEDRRWLRLKRPFVFVGGELRPEDLDLTYDPAGGFHQAPPHIKAQGGLLAIDDFGRQQVTPQALMNRWIAALERGEDNMTLETGERVTMPFSATIVFSSNLEPTSILDEAHLRRIPYKVRLPNPTSDELVEIFRRQLRDREIIAGEESIRQAVEVLERITAGNTRSCHPRDLVNLITEEAQFFGKDPVIDAASTERACTLYFGG